MYCVTIFYAKLLSDLYLKLTSFSRAALTSETKNMEVIVPICEDKVKTLCYILRPTIYMNTQQIKLGFFCFVFLKEMQPQYAASSSFNFVVLAFGRRMLTFCSNFLNTI